MSTEIQEKEIDIHKIILHLKRNFFTIFFITFFLSIGVGIYTYLQKPIYSSNVSISFLHQKMSKLTFNLPKELSQFQNKESQLESIKLTLKTRQFIEEIISHLKLEEQYFIKSNFRKKEIYTFDNLDIKLDIKDPKLYNKEFSITPLDEKTFVLEVEKIKFMRTYSYNEEIIGKGFLFNVKRKGKPKHSQYFIKRLDPNLLANRILKNMQVNILSENIIQIIYSDGVAKRAKEVVSEMANHFIKFTIEKKNNELSQTLFFLKQQLRETKINLTKDGNKLKKYQQKNHTLLPLKSSETLSDLIREKEEQINNLKLQRQEVINFKDSLYQNRLNTVSLLNSGIDISSIQLLIELFRDETLELNEMSLQELDISKSITNNMQLSALIQQLNTQKRRLSDLEFNFTSGHPQVLKSHANILAIEEEITTYIAANVERLRQSQKLTKQKILSNIIRTEQNINSKLKIFRKDIREKRSLLKSLPEKDLNVQNLKRTFKLSENVYTFLLEKKMELEIEKASTSANTKIIEKAREADYPSKPNKKIIFLIGVLLSLIFAILFTVLKELLNTTIKNISMVEEITDTPIYGFLPSKHKKSLFNEAVRDIRTNLQFILPKEKKCKTLLVSSMLSGEGKTTLAAALAHTLTRSGKRVLIMDLDLRKPRLYKELGKSNKIGMTQYLLGETSFTNIVQSVKVNFDFIPAGDTFNDPAELLMGQRFETIITQLMKQYDYIVYDTAPIGIVIDAHTLLKYCDTMLFVIRAGYTKKQHLQNFNKLKEDKKINSVGIVVNQLKVPKANYDGYGYGYDYRLSFSS